MMLTVEPRGLASLGFGSSAMVQNGAPARRQRRARLGPDLLAEKSGRKLRVRNKGSLPRRAEIAQLRVESQGLGDDLVML